MNMILYDGRTFSKEGKAIRLMLSNTYMASIKGVPLLKL
jgi:hypothetical protein